MHPLRTLAVDFNSFFASCEQQEQPSLRGHTPDLFKGEKAVAKERLFEAMDTLNQTCGHGTVYLGGAFGVTQNAPMRIAYTRIPRPEVEEIDPRRERRVRPLQKPVMPDFWEGC